jgi:penicillin amidase
MRWRQDAGVVEAVERLGRWDFSTPTGIREGFDASDVDGRRAEPSPTEVAHSVAATLYTLWRGRFIVNTVDVPTVRFGMPLSGTPVQGLKHLLDHLASNGGRGASGLDFLEVPGVTAPNDRRDILILKSLRDALDLLAGDRFADAFHRSTNQQDYRWGRIHRLHCPHLMGDPFGIPPAGGAFPHPLPDLPGIPVDGSNITIDVTGHPWRADETAAFLDAWGPAVRFVTEARVLGMRARFALPGGASGVLGNRHLVDLLPGWLTNDGVGMPFSFVEILWARESVLWFLP